MTTATTPAEKRYDRLLIELSTLRAELAQLELENEALLNRVATWEPFCAAYIRLSDDEWGNELMDQRAREFLASNPAVDVVTVHEHAGWFLIYYRDGDDVLTIGSANDQAVYTGRKKQIRDEVLRRGTRVIHTF